MNIPLFVKEKAALVVIDLQKGIVGTPTEPHAAVDVVANAAKLAKEVKLVGLPDKAYKLAITNFKAKKTGTGFGGVAEVGVSVEELLQREGKH